jgi:hypothetical protein
MPSSIGANRSGERRERSSIAPAIERTSIGSPVSARSFRASSSRGRYGEFEVYGKGVRREREADGRKRADRSTSETRCRRKLGRAEARRGRSRRAGARRRAGTESRVAWRGEADSWWLLRGTGCTSGETWQSAEPNETLIYPRLGPEQDPNDTNLAEPRNRLPGMELELQRCTIRMADRRQLRARSGLVPEASPRRELRVRTLGTRSGWRTRA